ncbi:MAG: hypothetical protein AMXMBFR33_04160 [Candidatus Xenobia bacterium]
MEVPDQKNLFVLGALERNVSIYLQQVRALNLAWDLGRRGPVAVIGGGFAGLTAAAGLTALGTRAVVFERQDQLLKLQRGNRVRWIHPHIHEWPRPGAEDPRAGLPLMDWQAGYAGDVAESLLAQVDFEVRLNSRVTLETGWKVNAESFEAVILAVGLGVEKTFGNLPLLSYWLDRDIEAGGRVFISGCGEGGLIDALYLKLTDFRHDRVVSECLSGLDELKARLLELEDGLENADPVEAGQKLTRAYATLAVPEKVDACLAARLRKDTDVVLNSPSSHFLTNKADILNRFLISRLHRMGAVAHVPGKLQSIEPEGERWRVQLDTGLDEPYDRVLVRHGTVPALKSEFARWWEPYLAVRKERPFEVPVPRFQFSLGRHS